MDEPKPMPVGSRVKIVTCAHHSPDHVGKVGTLLQRGNRTRLFSVSFDRGLCQATEVVPVDRGDPEVSQQAPS